jgi:leader peptidase (prepilin peptidase)/N-methyltransferase
VHVLWIIFIFAAGACIGSFLNVVIYRLPRGESIAFPGSHCPHCGKPIKWYDNIPILSWLLLRAKCRNCHRPISPRYIFIEFLTAVLVTGLYVCFFVLEMRDGAGLFPENWPMFVAHAALLCGLLAAAVVDIDLFIVPLEVMWVCAGVGVAAAALAPQSPAILPPASPAVAAVCVGAVLGLIIAGLLQRLGILQESFIDASDKPLTTAKDAKPAKHAKPDKPGGRPANVAITSAHGVNPRVEILREAVYVGPAVILAAAGYFLVQHVPPVYGLFAFLVQGASGHAPHVASGLGAVFGMLVGIAWIWGTRIFGTLGFGKEAMGMGDVHIMAAIGAVMGWKAVSLTFFAAPFFALIWGLYLLLARGRRELPYGPWLAVGALIVMLFYDDIIHLILPPGIA